MIESEFETVNLSYESYKFREELRNELLLQVNYSEEPETWDMKENGIFLNLIYTYPF